MLLKNGLLVFEDGSRKGDLRISGERILEFGEKLPEIRGEESLDLEGLVVMPGGVDVHTHMDLDLGTVRSTDDFFTGTVAAACGGTTAIVDHMAFGPSGCSPRHQVDVYHRLAEGKAVIDYGF
ncbi:MAG: dihydropyrimidinase, partial [Treponema sp.]|nr:dihydropyrimidinase [Treponema sp.]